MKNKNKKQQKYFAKAIIFFIALLVLLIFFNSLYIKYVEEDKPYFIKEQRYNSWLENLDQKKVGTGFFGYSHTAEGINPEYIEDSYNFASPGRNYIKTYYDLRRIVYKDNLDMDVAVFEIDLQSFSSAFADPVPITNPRFGLEFMSYKEIAEINNEGLIQLWIRSNFPIIGNGIDFNRKQTSPTDFSRLGWVRINRDFSLVDDKEEKALGTYRFHFENQEKIDRKVLEYFLKTIELAEKNNIKIVFVKLPMDEEYDKLVKDIEKKEYYDEIFENIDSTLSNEYIILDYYADFFGKSEYFADADHLNEKGAEVISKQINIDLNSLEFSKTTEQEPLINSINLNKAKVESGFENQKTILNNIFLTSLIMVTTTLILFLIISLFLPKKRKR